MTWTVRDPRHQYRPAKCATIGCMEDRYPSFDYCRECLINRSRMRMTEYDDRGHSKIDKEPKGWALSGIAVGAVSTVDPNRLFDPRRVTTTKALVEIQAALSAKGRDIISIKNRDYGDHDADRPDPFANFRPDGAYGIVVRMSDKLARLRTFTKTRRLAATTETYLDTAVDLMNYCAILVAYVMDEEARNSNNPKEEPK